MVRNAPFLAILAIAAVLLSWRLGAVYLWQDEAATAVMSERMLRFGKPLAYDGVNLITMDSFADEDPATLEQRTGSVEAELRYLVARHDFKPDTTWVGHPWGQFVVAAASLGLLGHGTAQARLPFALASLVTLVLVYLVTLRALKDRVVATLAAALLATNVFWILHGRQCRYYALSSLGLMLSLAAFLRWRRGGRLGAASFVVAAWVSFHCDFGSFFPMMAVLGAVALADASRPRRDTLVVFTTIAACVAPFVLYYELHSRLRNPVDSLGDMLLTQSHNINAFVVAAPVLALACWTSWRGRAALDAEKRRLLLASLGIIFATLVWVSAVAPVAFHRYVVQLTPVAAILTAWTLVSLGEAAARRLGVPHLRTSAAVALSALVALTAVASAPLDAALLAAVAVARDASTRDADLAVAARRLIQWQRPEIPAAIREIFEERPDPNRQVIEALASRIRPGDEILVNYEDVPFMFYTSARIRGGVAAFRATDVSSSPRFAVIRRSVPFVHWPVFQRELDRFRWRMIRTGAPDLPFGNFPDPTWFPPPWVRSEVQVGERLEQ